MERQLAEKHESVAVLLDER